MQRYSFSKLALFQKCPCAYHYSYVMRLPSAPNIFQYSGASVHEGIEKFLKGKPMERCLEMLDHKMESVSESVEGKELAKKLREPARKALASFQYYYSEELKGHKIIGVECFRAKKISPEKMLVSRTDLVTENNGEANFHDYKFSQSEPNPEQYKMQLEISALTHNSAGAKMHLRYLSTAQTFSWEENEGELQSAAEKVLSTIDEIGRSKFEKKQGPLCKWCGWKGQCGVQ